MYIFIRNTIPVNYRYRISAAVIGALFYMYNPYWLFRIQPTPHLIYLIALLPLFALFCRQALLTRTLLSRRTVQKIILAGLTTLLMTPGLANLAGAAVAMLFVGLYLLLLSIHKKVLRRFFIIAPVIGLLILVLNLWWIWPNLQHATVQSALTREGIYMTQTLQTLETSGDAGWTTYPRVIRGFTFPIVPEDSSGIGGAIPPDSHIFERPLFIFIEWPIAVIAFGSLYSKTIRQKTDSLPLLITTVILIPFVLVGFHPPFGGIVRWLVENVPLYVFRRPAVYVFFRQ